jgi:Domain of Unknown Function (DUF1080)
MTIDRRTFVGMLSCGIPLASRSAQPEPTWTSLFDGRTLGDWAPTSFGGEGQVHVRDGAIVLERGNDLTGITWRGALPATDRDRYEIELEARRVAGDDFFCGLTFPVRDRSCSFIVGGWAGAVTGLSSLDGLDASENETTRIRNYEANRWYRVRVRVLPERLQAWIDDESFADVTTTGRRVDIRPEVQASRPLGVACWRTRAELRHIRRRPIAA